MSASSECHLNRHASLPRQTLPPPFFPPPAEIIQRQIRIRLEYIDSAPCTATSITSAIAAWHQSDPSFPFCWIDPNRMTASLLCSTRWKPPHALPESALLCAPRVNCRREPIAQIQKPSARIESLQRTISLKMNRPSRRAEPASLRAIGGVAQFVRSRWFTRQLAPNNGTRVKPDRASCYNNA